MGKGAAFAGFLGSIRKRKKLYMFLALFVWVIFWVLRLFSWVFCWLSSGSFRLLLLLLLSEWQKGKASFFLFWLDDEREGAFCVFGLGKRVVF